MSKANSAISGAATGAVVGGPLGALAGGAAGFLLGKDDNSSDYLERMLEEVRNIPLPVLKEMNPELYKVVTQLNPEMESNVVLGPSATQGISLDPRYKQAQLEALSKLTEISSNNGQDAQSKADFARLENSVNSIAKGNTGAIQQNLATRGLSGGMSESIGKQIEAQESANRASQMGMDLNAQAQNRALQALMNQTSVANQLSNNDLNLQNTKAQASDAISKFNAQNLQNTNSQNTAAKNNAQQWNAQNNQSVANQNVGVKNSAQQYNLQLPQMNYENELRKRGMINTGYQNLAQNSYNQAKDQDQFLGGLFSSGAQAWSKK